MTTLSKCMIPSLKNELFNTLYVMVPDTSAVIYIIEMITNEIDNNARLFHISRWGVGKQIEEHGQGNYILPIIKIIIHLKDIHHV